MSIFLDLDSFIYFNLDSIVKIFYLNNKIGVKNYNWNVKNKI